MVKSKSEIVLSCVETFSRSNLVVLVNVLEARSRDIMKRRAFIISQSNSYFNIIRDGYPVRDMKWFLRIDKFNSSGWCHSIFLRRITG